jgi:hypothetical protein
MTHREDPSGFQDDRRVGKEADYDVEKAKALWVDRAMRLIAGRDVTPEVRLAHYRAQCHAQRLLPDACFYSTAFVLMGIAVDRMAGVPRNRMLKRWLGSNRPRDEIHADSGLEESVGSIIEGESADIEIIRATFREYGEPDIAELFINEPEEFERRYKRGQKYLSHSSTHEHRWTLLDLFAFDGPVYFCRDCSERRTVRD